MTLDDFRFTSVLLSPNWQREAVLRFLKLLGFYSLLPLGGAFLLLLLRGAIAWITGPTVATFVVTIICGCAAVYFLYHCLIDAVKTPAQSANRSHLPSARKLRWQSSSHLTESQKEIVKTPEQPVERGSKDLPFFGRIAAGRPIEALSGSDRVKVPSHLLSHSGGDHYVLLVVGESMINDGIHNGDFVIVLRRDWAEPGDMAVVIIGDDATLKRFYPEGNMVRLQPANPTMQSIRVPAKDVRVQGVVVGMIRKY